MNPKKIDQIGCIDIGSNAIKYKQFRIIANDNQSYSKELETYKRIPIVYVDDIEEVQHRRVL